MFAHVAVHVAAGSVAILHRGRGRVFHPVVVTTGGFVASAEVALDRCCKI